MSSAAPERSWLAASLTLLPESQRRLLQGCALVSSLDETIVGELGRELGVADAPKLADLAAFPFIHEDPGRPGRYRIRDDVRQALIESWWEGKSPDSVPAELSGLSARLADRLSSVPGTDPAEVVGLRLFADPMPALEQWKELYHQADRRFDLAGCRSLIAMLGWMAAVRSEVEEVRVDYATYVEARSLWTDEWYSTGSFLLPAASRNALESLIEGDQGRMLELQGYGGYGKTMHIRWLIARRCVSARIPCARIDFDVVDAVAATREPHLVLLELADQLDRQLPGDAFGMLLRNYGAERIRLYRSSRAPARARGAGGPGGEEIGSASADDVLRRFAGRLAEMRADRPVMLILDTLEIPLHLPDTSAGMVIRPLLAALATVLRQAPAVRLILAGRYEMSESLRDLFTERADRFELPRFSEEEGTAYLIDKRGVEPGKLVEAAWLASDGVPFSLALLADLIDEGPGISPRQIAEYHGAEYAYLVEKVVKRITEQPVRWVLRYAAIPRRFDFEFVRDVLWRRVSAEMNGTGGLDDPADDDLPPTGEEGVLWAVGELPQAEEQTVRQVWDAVRRYASGSSWIRPDVRDPDALRLQTEVVRPLRELLVRQPIFAVLHADASEYFLHRAAQESAQGESSGPGEPGPGRRDEFLGEAVFHRFQVEGEAAGPWWEEQIRAAPRARARRALASELVRGREYTDRDGRPVPWGDGRTVPWGSHGMLVSEQTLQQARLEFCLASAELATLPAPQNPNHPLWVDAGLALERLLSFRTDALPPGRVALAEAAVAIGTRRPGDHSGVLRAALDDPGPSPRERLWLAVLDAQRLIAAGSAEADARLEEAKRFEREAMGERDVRQALAYALVTRLRERGALTEAMAACMIAVAEGLGDGPNFRLAQAEMLLSSGDAEGARAIAETLIEDGSPLAPLAQVFAARCWRRQQRFSVAAACVRRALAAQQARDPSPPPTWIRAHALMESGEIAAARLQVQQARTAYAAAARLAEADQAALAAGCHLQEARLLMNDLGHLRAAGVALDAAERAAPAGSELAVLARLTRAELAHDLGDRVGAETILDPSGSADPRAALPTRMAATAVAGLAFGKRRDRDLYIRQLTQGMRQVSPPTARLQLLTRAHRCPVLTPQSKPQLTAVAELREAVIPAGGWDAELAGLAVPDRITLGLRAATFARMVDDPGEALRMLAAALQESHGLQEPLAWLTAVLRQARQLAAPGQQAMRSGAADLVTAAGQQAVRIASAQAEEYPLLAAVTVIEYLGAVMEVGGTPAEDPASLLPRAERWLGGEGSSDQAWRARLFELYAAIGTTDRAVAASYRTAAVQMYDGAGDVQASEEAQSRAPRPDVRPDAGRPRVVVNVTLRQGVVKAQVEKRHRLLPRRRGPAADPLPGMIARWTAGGAAEPYPPELPALMADRWPEFTRFLTELINAADLTVRQRRTVGQPDLAVRVKDGALQSMPWELAARPKADKPLFAEFRRAYRCPAREAPDTRLVRVVQAGLNLLGNYNVQVDGVSGPDTAKALDAYSRAQDAPLWRLDDPEMVQHLHEALLQGARPTVIILRSAAGASHPRDLALERRYAQAGFAVTVVDQVHLPALPTLLRGEPPPVIVHIVGGLVATAGATAVDLNDDASAWGSSDETGLLTSADLDQTLRVVSLDWPAPVVVLDVPVPSGDRETGDQLLLRNWFAGDLFALGGTRAVIGTGLAGRKASDLVRDVLIERLAHGDAIGDVVQAMRQQGPSADFGGFGSGVAFAAIALWGNDPGIRLPARGGS